MARETRGNGRKPDRLPGAVVEWELDLDGENWDEFEQMEIGLPLAAENFTTGGPLVTVDYFDLRTPDRCAVAAKLMTLDGAMEDTGSSRPRVLVFDTNHDSKAGQPRALIAIATVRGESLRVEVARRRLCNAVRRAVETALGTAARHRLRTQENPVQYFLDES